jgi:zinc protease
MIFLYSPLKKIIKGDTESVPFLSDQCFISFSSFLRRRRRAAMRLRIKHLAAVIVIVSLIAPALALAQNKTAQDGKNVALNDKTVLPPINYTEFRLSNGLRVILHEDRSTPIVAVNIWYHVGSKNEVPGRTGFAHLFEHMMFQGSKHYDKDYFVPLQEAGGNLNGSTNSDRTNYWEVVPSNFLELALWLESDRMGYLLDALSEEKLSNQRDVVKNEKRQNYDNRPYGLAAAKISETMYPKDHPYHWLTIGELEDIAAATREDVSDFFRRFYTPNNASLVIAGDFDPKEARQLAEKYFGPLKRGPEVEPVRLAQPRLDKEVRLMMEDRVSLPRLYMAWHTTPQWTAGDAELDTLATVLAGSKGSRLYKSLVYEKQIAQDVTAFQNSREIAGQFQIVATAKPGKTLAELEQAIKEEIDKIKSAPPNSEEMERAYNARESAYIYSLQTVGGFGGKSDQLNQYAVYLDKPNYFQEDLARYARVTAEDVRRMANEYLTDKRLVLTVTPRQSAAKTTGEPLPEGPKEAIASPSKQTAGMQSGGSAPNPATQTPTPGAQTTAPVTAEAKSTDKPAGAQSQTKAEADATRPAGATPPATTAPAPGVNQEKTKEETKDTSKLGGLYVPPAPKPDPIFTLPRIERRKLSNGLEVLIVNHKELPLVSLNLVLKTGSAADPKARAGLASFTAALIDEGTKTRNALDISNQLAAIGARLGTGADWDLTGVSLLTLTRHMDRALEIYSDVITNPTFPENELKLQRETRLAALLQRRDDANSIAAIVYASLLYGREHPYGHPLIGDDESVRAITNEEVKRFYETYYRPNNATLIVVGDAQAETLLPKLERAFSNWKAGDVPAVNIPQPPSRDKGVVYLVDKPGSAQSVIAIGQIGLPRSTPDYFPLVVLNTLLGGQFTSRVNMNLRENKGYTYGARTSFDYRRGAGPFAASAGVQTAVTKESVVEFLKELRGVRGEIPVTPAELEFSKQAIIRGFPRSFETPEQISSRLTDIVLHDLRDDYFNNYIANIRAVTMADVTRVANRYLDPSKMAILVVGDRKTIEPGLRSLDSVGSTLTLVDIEGRIISGSNGSGNDGGSAR